MISKILLSAAFLFSALTAFSQNDNGEKMPNKMIKVNNPIYMLQGKGGNIGLSIGYDGIFMIDDQYSEGIKQIQEDIKKKSDKPVRFLLNTHFHGDHTGGNAAMAETGTVIFSQENVRDRLQKIMQNEEKKIPMESLPVVTFSEDLTFHFNNEKIYIFHLHNAHTDGDAMVYFTGSNVLHTGDIFFNGKYPYIDTENGGSLMGYIEAIEKALHIINEDTKIIPGHGNVGSYQDLQSALDMLYTVYKKVTANYINKKTEEEIVKMTDITKQYDYLGYGTGFIKTEDFLKMVYGEVAKERSYIKDNEAVNKKAREKVEQMMKEQEKKKKG